MLLELLFTGASSVTTTMLWALHHLAQPGDGAAAQHAARCEAAAALRAAPLPPPPLPPGAASAAAPPLDDAAPPAPPSLGELGAAVPSLDAVLRETLRLYSPIHIGRVALQARCSWPRPAAFHP